MIYDKMKSRRGKNGLNFFEVIHDFGKGPAGWFWKNYVNPTNYYQSFYHICSRRFKTDWQEVNKWMSTWAYP